MKLKYWAMSLLACGGMLACTNEDVTGENGTNSENDITYLTVNIMSAGSPATRAFAVGSEAENAVTKARFYFFDAAGNAFSVSNSLNYVEKTDLNLQASTGNVEETSSEAVLVLEAVEGKAPHSMITIINPPASLGNDSKTLTQLKDEVKDYATDLTSSGSFVMSNSVYLNGSAIATETEIGSYLKDTPADAKNNPVSVYVERVLAKVMVAFTGADATIDSKPAYLVHDDSNDDNNDVYAKIMGWQIADCKSNSYLLKKIDATWTSEATSIGFAWNAPTNFRSYWATSSTGNLQANEAWNEINLTVSTDLTSNPSYTYTQENTPTTAITDNYNNDLTKVIVAVQLVKKDNTNSPRYLYLGAEYASEAAILGVMADAALSQYYIKTGESTYTPVSNTNATNVIEFKTAKGINANATTDTYKVYPQVKGTITLYIQSGGSYNEVADITSINTNLQKYSAQVWKDGKAYYYTTISHLASSGIGTYGVVRNHVYQVFITDIASDNYGTPVYDPDEVIDPENPDDESVNLAAKINILSWNVVSSNVTLGGN